MAERCRGMIFIMMAALASDECHLLLLRVKRFAFYSNIEEFAFAKFFSFLASDECHLLLLRVKRFAFYSNIEEFAFAKFFSFLASDECHLLLPGI